jgi:hypothetical protein
LTIINNFILKTNFYYLTTMGRKSKNQAANVDNNNGSNDQDEFEPTNTAPVQSTPVTQTPVQPTPVTHTPSPAKQGKSFVLFYTS